jgi:hypothetical protein
MVLAVSWTPPFLATICLKPSGGGGGGGATTTTLYSTRRAS